ADFLVESAFVRIDMRVHERRKPRLQVLHFRGVVEVHCGSYWMCFSICRQPSSAMGRARLPVSTAWALAALPARARAMTPWKIAAARNMLYARQQAQSLSLGKSSPVRARERSRESASV